MCYWLRRLGIYIGLSNYCIWENTASDIVIQIASYYTKNVTETDKGERERERERERDKPTHSVSESDSPTTARFLCGSGGVLGYCSLINTDRDLFFCSRLFGLFFKGLLRVYGGLSMLWWARPSSIATLLTGEPSCFCKCVH